MTVLKLPVTSASLLLTYSLGVCGTVPEADTENGAKFHSIQHSLSFINSLIGGTPLQGMPTGHFGGIKKQLSHPVNAMSFKVKCFRTLICSIQKKRSFNHIKSLSPFSQEVSYKGFQLHEQLAEVEFL